MSMIDTESEVHAVAFSKEGATLAGGCADSKIRLWDAHSGNLRQTIALNTDERLAGMPSGTGLMVVASKAGGVELRELTTGKRSQRFAVTGPVSRRLAATSEAMLIAGSNRVGGISRDEVMRVWEPSGAERFAVAAGVGGASAIAISPNGKFLAAGSFDTDVRVWSTKNGEMVRRIDEILVSTFAMEFTPDGKYLLTGGVDRILYLWDTSTWKLARKFAGQPEMISAISVAPGGRWIATGGESEFANDNPVKILVRDASTGEVVRSFDAPRHVESLAFSPDATLLAAAYGRKSIQLWSIGKN
jgi:WD40 repeat protein